MVDGCYGVFLFQCSGFFLHINFGGGYRLKTVTVVQSALFKIHWVCMTMKGSIADHFVKQTDEGDETHPEWGPSEGLRQKCRVSRPIFTEAPPLFFRQRLFAAATTGTEPGSTFWSPTASCHVSLWTTQPDVTRCVLLCKLRSTPATQPFWVFTLRWAVPVAAARWHAMLYILYCSQCDLTAVGSSADLHH